MLDKIWTKIATIDVCANSLVNECDNGTSKLLFNIKLAMKFVTVPVPNISAAFWNAQL